MFAKASLRACLLVSLTLVTARADQPGTSPPITEDGPGSSNIPSAGFRRTVELLRLRRNLALPGMALAPGVNLELSGNRSVPVICVEFSNRAHHFEAEAYQQLLFDDPTNPPSPPRPTFTQYYRDISDGRFIPTGRVFGWYTLPQEDAFYELDNNGLNTRLGELLKFAFEHADNEVDFGQFDNDGPDGLPNSGDDDGIVDTLFVIHSEKGGECGPQGVNKNMWSHSFQYSKLDPAGGKFVTDDARLDEFGQPFQGENNRVRIEDYTLQPAVDCDSSPQTPQIVPIGVFCHEYGHALGLPDLYDRTPPDNADSEGVGNYCLMAGGSYGANGNNAALPVQMSAWCKCLLGWARIVKVDANKTIDLEPASQSNLVYNIDVPGTGGREFFLIEFRDAKWQDQFNQKLNWDREFNPSGIAVWHVDERVGEASLDWPFTPAGTGQNDHPSIPASNGIGFRDEHSLVSLIQRDRQQHLERDKNRGDAGDLFITGSELVDDPQLLGGTRSYGGALSGISLTNINLAAKSAKILVDAFPPGHIQANQVSSNENGGDVPILQLTLEEGGSGDAQLQQLTTQAKKAGIESLSEAEADTLAGQGSDYVRLALPSNKAHQLLVRSAEARTENIAKSPGVLGSLDKSIRQLVEMSHSSEATIRFAPDKKRVERIAGLQIMMESKEPLDDARRRIEGLQQPMAGFEAKFDLDHPKVELGKVVFPQYAEVGTDRLPIYGRGITFFYADNQFVGVEANVSDDSKPFVTVLSKPKSDEEIVQLLSDQLHVPQNRLHVGSDYLFSRTTSTSNAKVAKQVKLELGESQQDIDIIVDKVTGEVLEIK